MASTPVNEDEPLENARKNNKIVILDDDVPIAAAAWKATWPVAMLYNPYKTIPVIITMNK